MPGSSPKYLEGIPCPKCGEKLYDNRADKKNKKRPDFRCSNKACLDEGTDYQSGFWEKDFVKAGIAVPPLHPVATQGANGNGAHPATTWGNLSRRYEKAVQASRHGVPGRCFVPC